MQIDTVEQRPAHLLKYLWMITPYSGIHGSGQKRIRTDAVQVSVVRLLMLDGTQDSKTTAACQAAEFMKELCSLAAKSLIDTAQT